MNDREALLRTNFEQPDHDAPRLVYADWLEENQDQLHAEFIRVQIEIAGLPSGDPRTLSLKRRELVTWSARRVLRFRPRDWREEHLSSFARGFRFRWSGQARRLIDPGNEWWNDGPASFGQIWLERRKEQLQAAELAHWPWLQGFRELSVYGHWSDGWIRYFVSSLHLSRLQKLTLCAPSLADAEAEALLRSPLLRIGCRINLRVGHLDSQIAHRIAKTCEGHVEIN